ncbi:MAG: quinolinate synthase NadA [Fidelibacterota bacterium]|nr:MAG: quinolinate synthase NadA [Candidatus Neomarinimicrobiota bacterium]
MTEKAVLTSAPLLDEIQRLKEDRNAVILAHYYQDPEIQDLADYLGDSLQLAQVATKTDAEVIVFCGVHFMAETAKILNPEKKVLLPDLSAGCSLAESCPADKFESFIQRHPGHAVVSYINTTAAVKALSDIICTSSNMERVLASIPEDQPVIFAPDSNMGHYLKKRTGRRMEIWPGTCTVHVAFSAQLLQMLRTKYPDALLLAHPECDETILSQADHVGSTTAIIKAAVEGRAQQYLIATEAGVIHQMEQLAPGKEFIPVPTIDDCPCSLCPYMRVHTPEKVLQVLRDLSPEITLEEELRLKALRPLERMMALG